MHIECVPYLPYIQLNLRWGLREPVHSISAPPSFLQSNSSRQYAVRYLTSVNGAPWSQALSSSSFAGQGCEGEQLLQVGDAILRTGDLKSINCRVSQERMELLCDEPYLEEKVR